VAYADKGRARSCARRLRPLAQDQSEGAGHLSNRGLAYYAKHDFARAVADYSASLRHYPRDAKVIYTRGNAYSSLGQSDRAMTDYNEAIRLAPQDPLAFYNRGNEYYGRGDDIDPLARGLRQAAHGSTRLRLRIRQSRAKLFRQARSQPRAGGLFTRDRPRSAQRPRLQRPRSVYLERGDLTAALVDPIRRSASIRITSTPMGHRAPALVAHGRSCPRARRS